MDMDIHLSFLSMNYIQDTVLFLIREDEIVRLELLESSKIQSRNFQSIQSIKKKHTTLSNSGLVVI
jgi:PhoPQ-activated pathogenicity-related protein